MKRQLIALAALMVAGLFIAFAVPAQAGGCSSRTPCTPVKPVCKCVTISQADFNACGGQWYASTSEDWRSPMFYGRKGCICTYKSNTWSFVGSATNRTYLWNIWVGR